LEQLILEQGKKAKEAARDLASLSSEVKDRVLMAMAELLIKRQDSILRANQEDLREAREKGLAASLLDRLLLTEDRIEAMAEGLREIAFLPDPVGEISEISTRPNGLRVGKMRSPLGVVGIIYEARPNVTVDATGLCLKAGNSVLLRGGSEAIRSNQALVQVLKEALIERGLSENSVQLIQSTDRDAVVIMAKMDQYLDVIIPRGGRQLIKRVTEAATVPVIQTGVGNCHIYLDEKADLEKAVPIIKNAKCQRPGVCNALETLLVHQSIGEVILPQIGEALTEGGVLLKGCPKTQKFIPNAELATEEDWATEYLDLTLAIKVVDSYREALDHIHQFSTGHSEAIITEDYSKALDFLKQVDSATVYVNASTRFTDGNQFGLGAEVGISTQKLHVRGPMGVKDLTTQKYVIFGNGQIRS